MGLIRIARIADLTEARVIEAGLKAQGIHVTVPEAQFGQTDFLMQTALGGFGILVPEDQAQEAAAFIREYRDQRPAPEIDDPDDEDDGASWEEGRRKRRNTVVRWLVVTAFFGPFVLAVLALFVGRIVQLLGG